MMRSAAVAAGIGIALGAAPPALAGPAYMGGSLPEAAVTGSAYTPTVGVTLQPLAGNRVRIAFDTTLRCGRTVSQIRRTRTAIWDGRTLTGRGTAKRPRFKWALEASADGQTATGTLRVTARRNGKAGSPTRTSIPARCSTASTSRRSSGARA